MCSSVSEIRYSGVLETRNAGETDCPIANVPNTESVSERDHMIELSQHKHRFLRLDVFGVGHASQPFPVPGVKRIRITKEGINRYIVQQLCMTSPREDKALVRTSMVREGAPTKIYIEH
ncbi:hypothetical protein N7492_004718 [Penicillium capsulatum]|uniref:Uncharacterized protein n=1 Tax=Penicillium capsulatum TaxID=69766 RepID=A0A9W9I8A5_9EURO|nr:hypothetical protein N7492_004718 [Penicillium capsulatum]